MSLRLTAPRQPFCTWRVEEDDPLDIGVIEIADGMHARADRYALNARMTDVGLPNFLQLSERAILF